MLGLRRRLGRAQSAAEPGYSGQTVVTSGDCMPRASPRLSLRSDAVHPRGGAPGRNRTGCHEEPLSFESGRSRARRFREPPVSGVAGRLAEAGRPRAFLPKAASHPRLTEVGRWCKTRSGDSTTPPMGFGPLRRLNPGDLASVCLSDTIRSQSFSLSQRFDLTRASWPCFVPHPPLGFAHGLQSFSRSASRTASRRPLPSCRYTGGALALLGPTSGRCSDRASVLG